MSDREKGGARAEAPGSRASTEPQGVSAVPASIPRAEYPRVEYEEIFVPMAFEHPVGRDLEQWRENVRKTDLYRRGDTVLVWVNEGDLYADGPFVKHLRRRASGIAARSDETPVEAAQPEARARPDAQSPPEPDPHHGK